jgi:hypothetical protein
VLPYWLLFSIPACASVFEHPNYGLKRLRVSGPLIGMAIVICVVVGLRYQVGADWDTYVQYLFRASYSQLSEIPGLGDPGYIFLNWVAGKAGADIWLVNLACAGFFTWGLVNFALAQPRPWLALTVAIPYLVIVVAMGYTRQGVAIGLAMAGFASLGTERSNIKFVVWVLLAASFHKSAVLLIPIAALAENRGRFWTICWVSAATILAYFALLESSVDKIMYNYVQRQYDSGGTAIRVAMNAVPAAIALYFRKEFPFRESERTLWTILSALALCLIPGFIAVQSSTAIDRLGLYLIPLQLIVLSRLPDFIATSENTSRLLSFSVVLYSALIMFIWLTYASHSDEWLPYQLYPF